MKRYLCIHCHFYQPPRENPWLEAIERQDSAYPCHDWNERIAAECYAPNGASRILDSEERIAQIVNNYERISFNFGPTLLSWLETKKPKTYQAILAADHSSRRRFSGHGAALGQVYNHMILPLANHRDKVTQIRWGIEDFESRFGRKPEGFWLSETAVDLETLDLLVDHGIRFTLLAPSQARRVRRIDEPTWHDVPDGRCDPTMAYQVELPSGRTIAVFFYDSPISRGVAFEGLLVDGKRFADRLLGAFSGSRKWPQLVHIATDGETYGHHHRHGDMALAFALRQIDGGSEAELTIYAEFLERHPPTYVAELYEPSSWSCLHGVDRWRTDCGCSTGGHPAWNQAWRTPLRESLDWLRDQLEPLFEQRGGRLLNDPWGARDRYIRLILDRSTDARRSFFETEATGPPDEKDGIETLRLLEMQRHAMLMYTSCGWFFEELSGIETVQILRYAGRAIQLAGQLTGIDLEAGFLARLEEAKSNVAEHRDGARIYQQLVKPAMVDLKKVCGHYAIRSLFDEYDREDQIYCYSVERMQAERLNSGKWSSLLGRARLRSEITLETADLTYGVLHFGDHNLQAGIREYRGAEEFGHLTEAAQGAFSRGDLSEVLRVVDRHFEGATYSLKSLFRDEQRTILDRLLETTLSGAEAALRNLYEHHVPLMRFLGEIESPLPRPLLAAAEFVINANLRRLLIAEEPDTERIREELETARQGGVPLDGSGLGHAISSAMERLMTRLAAEDADSEVFPRLRTLAEIASEATFDVDLWGVQNLYYDVAQSVYLERNEKDAPAQKAWTADFRSLGDLLGVWTP